jgi:NAD(P)-dependent dehydrogenase (short-subunit alcohol dehydrogenase family)
MTPPESRVAAVTGAGKGIGRAIAIELARAGMRVALMARNRDDLAAVTLEAPGSIVVPVDVRAPRQVTAAFMAVTEELGPVDVLVNAAGVYHFGPTLEATEEAFDRVVDTNLKGTFLTCRSVLGSMIDRRKGHIINIASIAGKVGSAGRSVYSASKFGVVGLTQSMAEEVRESGVRVAVVCPGSTNTTFSPKETAGKSREKMIQPADVAHVIHMLVTSGDNSFISEVVMRPTRKP